MKIIIDNKIIKLLVSNPSTITTYPLLADPSNQICFRWSSLLEYLDLGSLFTHLPAFDSTQPIFQACLATLFSHDENEKESLYYMYDKLFAENLCSIKDLPQIQPSSLLQAIERRKADDISETKSAFSLTLNTYEKLIKENPAQTMHNLILYLAWDRMCVCVAQLFDYQSTNAKFINGLINLKECLIESYQHITQQGRAKPSIYRLFETLFFYYMREERLQTHLPEEWAILSQGFQIFKGQEELVDFHYIDDAVFSEIKDTEASECYLSMDSSDRIQVRLAFANIIMNKLKSEVPGWKYSLDQKIIKVY